MPLRTLAAIAAMQHAESAMYVWLWVHWTLRVIEFVWCWWLCVICVGNIVRRLFRPRPVYLSLVGVNRLRVFVQ